MDELTLLSGLGEDLSPRGLAAPDAMTRRVLGQTGTGAVRSRPFAGQLIRGRRAARRPLVWLVPVGAAAAAVGLVATGALPFGGSAQTGPGTTASQAGRSGQGQVNLDARSILLAAAAQARSEPAVVPDAKSYIYSRASGRMEDATEGMTHTASLNIETWLAVDGKRPGLGIESFVVDGKTVREVNDRKPCPTTRNADLDVPFFCSGPGYLSGLPEDAAGVLTYLRQPRREFGWIGNCSNHGTKVSCEPQSDLDVFRVGGEALLDRMMSPASRAALFEALSTLSGVKVLPDPVTIAGRSGLGLTIEVPPLGDPAASGDDGRKGQLTLVFDSTSHRLVAEKEETLDFKAGGKLLERYEFAVEPVQVVKKLGVRPDGTTADRSTS